MKKIFDRSCICFFISLALAGCTYNNIERTADPCADNLTASFESCASVTTVTADKCIITEAIIQAPDGSVFDKFVYHYDGTNYDRIDRYYQESTATPFPTTPTEIHNFTYNSNGEIAEVSYTTPLIGPGKWVWTYTYGATTLKSHLDIFKDDGSLEFSQEFEEFYVAAPKDSVYFYDGLVNEASDARALFEYKNGNLNRMGRPVTGGSCTQYGVQWQFRKNYYDDVPNVLKNYAVRYPFIIGKGIYGIMLETYPMANSKNNVIGRNGDDGLNNATEQYCWTFLENGSQTYWIKSFKADFRPATITYHYDCE